MTADQPDDKRMKVVDHPDCQRMREEMGAEAFDWCYDVLMRAHVHFGAHVLLMAAMTNPDFIQWLNAEMKRPAPPSAQTYHPN